MFDSDDFNTQYLAREAAIKAANQFNKTAIFDALAATDITTVTVTFDGEGDSGQIESVCALSREEPRDIPPASVEIREASWGNPDVRTVTKPLAEAIEYACYDFLREHHDGWENNAGAYGDFVFHVAERRLSLDVNTRFVDTTYSHHEY